MKRYQIDCTKFCGYVEIDDKGIIVNTFPMLVKFIGQPISNLTYWTKKKFDYCTLKEIENG
ncbi:MAG: hypothetical protein WC516_06120 [Patescibacteria group bacterium]|jgi:hypothetical protein